MVLTPASCKRRALASSHAECHNSSAKLGHRPDIDGIRAVAVPLVVVFHFLLITGVNSGFMGVDVFFVISGFLTTTCQLATY